MLKVSSRESCRIKKGVVSSRDCVHLSPTADRTILFWQVGADAFPADHAMASAVEATGDRLQNTEPCKGGLSRDEEGTHPFHQQKGFHSSIVLDNVWRMESGERMFGDYAGAILFSRGCAACDESDPRDDGRRVCLQMSGAWYLSWLFRWYSSPYCFAPTHPIPSHLILLYPPPYSCQELSLNSCAVF